MMSLPERLRQETRPLHEQTEQLFYTESLRNGLLSVADYSHLLRTHFIFHQSLELAIDRHPDFFQDYEPESRRKTPWLIADLNQLDIPLPQPMPGLLADWSPVALLGAAYVGEGSMLGGTLIWKLLQQNQAVQPVLKKARFYQGYGSNTGPNWRHFGTFLVTKGADHPDDVVNAAKQAFIDYQAIFWHTRS